jgi:hypothetical protein
VTVTPRLGWVNTNELVNNASYASERVQSDMIWSEACRAKRVEDED